MVEVDIHCNVIKCRKPLSIESQACVTSCSHIFCLDCSKKIFSNALICPACNTHLSEESDDIILTQLNPTEEYKSSVLAGLKPDIILDICSRAIAFYEYQTFQELNFRTILQKSTEEKYNSLRGQFDLMTRDLNHITKVEKEKQKAILNDYELEKKKSQQIYTKLEDKSKQFQKLQVMYEKLKRKSIAPNMQESFMNTSGAPLMISPRNNIMRFNNQPQPQPQIIDHSDDIISRLGSKSSVARSIYIPPSRPPTQNVMPSRISSRIPSPVKSIYSVRSSHHRKYYKTSTAAVVTNQHQPPFTPPISNTTRKHHRHHHYHHHNKNAPSEP